MCFLHMTNCLSEKQLNPTGLRWTRPVTSHIKYTVGMHRLWGRWWERSQGSSQKHCWKEFAHKLTASNTSFRVMSASNSSWRASSSCKHRSKQSTDHPILSSIVTWPVSEPPGKEFKAIVQPVNKGWLKPIIPYLLHKSVATSEVTEVTYSTCTQLAVAKSHRRHSEVQRTREHLCQYFHSSNCFLSSGIIHLSLSDGYVKSSHMQQFFVVGLHLRILGLFFRRHLLDDVLSSLFLPLDLLLHRSNHVLFPNTTTTIMRTTTPTTTKAICFAAWVLSTQLPGYFFKEMF